MQKRSIYIWKLFFYIIVRFRQESLIISTRRKNQHYKRLKRENQVTFADSIFYWCKEEGLLARDEEKKIGNQYSRLSLMRKFVYGRRKKTKKSIICHSRISYRLHDELEICNFKILIYSITLFSVFTAVILSPRIKFSKNQRSCNLHCAS